MEPESSEEGATFVTLQEVVVNCVVKKHNGSRNNRRLASLTGCKRSKQLFPGGGSSRMKSYVSVNFSVKNLTNYKKQFMSLNWNEIF